MDADHTVFVHFVNSAGAIVFQDDHAPPVGTSKWSGLVTYRRNIDVPATLPDGVYKIEAGVCSQTPAGAWVNYPLSAGVGVKPLDNNSFEIGTFTVDRNAPVPLLDSDGPVTLNLKGYRLTFDEEFKSLDVSAWGPGTRWIAHTPYNGDFGDATFANPGPDSPFFLKDGMLNIEAKKVNGKWQAGLLASVDSQGNGFSQTYGYFECCAKFPKGPGTWPAFWMGSTNGLKKVHPDVAEPEIDVVEQYGQWPNRLFTTLHLWGPGKSHVAWGDHFTVADMTTGFHRYGLLWDAKNIIWYFDGVEMFRRPTPPEARYPMYLMVNLALGSGWPIDHTPNPSIMQVKYIRAYAKGESKPSLAVDTSPESRN
ncbi:MAG TPA: glycoside hydrolase family 16 protein [Capsulimonadaceae bacterium]|nr:glycoside hydrolase family 16 protein [Capsulimonadaceae bacterium]